MNAGLTAYNYFMSEHSTYNKVNRYDTHKKSELRNVYNSIVKYNKQSPLYMFKMSNDVSSFAVDIKECARNIKNTIAALSENDSSLGFDKKAVTSSNSDLIDVSYIGDNGNPDAANEFDIFIEKLAMPQINIGNFLESNEPVGITPGKYMFNVDINNIDYEFEFSVHPGDTNNYIQEKLARMINNANMGLEATVVDDGSSTTSLKISSVATGQVDSGEPLFTVRENTAGIVGYLGIDNLVSEASNSSFKLNGISKSSYSNTFTIDKRFEVTLKGANTSNEPIKVGFKTDADAMIDNITSLVDAYNSTLNTAYSYSNSELSNSKFTTDISQIAIRNKYDLESIGLNVNEKGQIDIEENLLFQAITDDESNSDVLSILNNFKQNMGKRATSMLLNPMEYANKTIVAYKNPLKDNYSTPYITSIYSGMMFNSYC